MSCSLLPSFFKNFSTACRKIEGGRGRGEGEGGGGRGGRGREKGGRDKKGAMHKCSTIFTPYYLHMYLLLHIRFLHISNKTCDQVE